MKKNLSKQQTVILSIVFLVVTPLASFLFAQATVQAFCQEKCARKQQKNFGYNSNVKMNFSEGCYLDCISKNSKNYESQVITAQCISGNCINGKGSLIERDEYDYVGEFKNGKRHGQGTLTQINGAKYVGGWSDGQMHGQGTLTRIDGSIMKGLFKNGKFVGNETASESKSLEKWSDYQWSTDWNDAQEICSKLGMRLPTKDELSEAYETGISKKWKENTGYYWSGTETSYLNAYRVSMLSLDSQEINKRSNNLVRCIR